MTYEFTDQENKEFTLLTSRMRMFAYIMIFAGVVSIVGGIIDDFLRLHYILTGIIVIIVGITIFLPTDNFTNIVNTKGKDIKELMIGLKELNQGFNLVIISMTILLINLIVNLILIF